VRDTGWLEPDGWDPADHVYMQAELRAVTLAWLAGLACPVINRPDAALWYRPGTPFLAWRGLLRRSGLPLPEVVVTSDPRRGPRLPTPPRHGRCPGRRLHPADGSRDGAPQSQPG
jgi:hypothetical protein